MISYKEMMSRLTQKFGEMIATYMSIPGHVSETEPETDFVISGLRAAISANPVARRKILSDVSEILACECEDLEFLFTKFDVAIPASTSYEVMVPDFQSQLLAIAE